MKALVATDAHIFQTPDGKHWCDKIYFYSFWQRYLNVFDSVRIVARVKTVEKVEANYCAVDGDGVEVFPIPFFRGPKQLAKQYFAIQNRLKHVLGDCDVAIFRMPSQTAQMAYRFVKGKVPVAGEIVYDPYDDVKNNRGISKIISTVISRQLKAFCKKANGVSYVTEYSIQRHYPSYARRYGEDQTHFESYYSTITLGEDAFTQPREYSGIDKLTLVLSDVSMNSERKGERTLINALKLARERGCNVNAYIIGDGSMREVFEAYAKENGVGEYVEFTGLFSSPDQVRDYLKKADVYVFPTQAEGLPRGILEAMAVGLPVLSTDVGGIPEVIEKEYLFDPQDSLSFANAIVRLYNSPDELSRISKENYEKSLEYKNDILQKRRDDFYRKLKNLAENG